jgi:Thymidylate synthase complementing protein
MIQVKIIADSVNVNRKRITTFELVYPRYIHAEIMTHRLFSRNAQSSRAVPVKTALDLIRDDPVLPIVWGKNKAGMSSVEFLNDAEQKEAEWAWYEGLDAALRVSQKLSDIGLHKQWANRPTEAFSNIKVVLTATEFDNFFWLRDDKDAAQPEIVELARKMKTAYDENTPDVLQDGFWHVPYVHWGVELNKGEEFQLFFNSNDEEIDLETALKISASCCAQVSYRKLDDTLDKALDIYNKLFSGPKPHLSPVEHQAMAYTGNWFSKAGQDNGPFVKGVTHIDKNGKIWSNNFKEWIQHRALLEQGTAIHLL